MPDIFVSYAREDRDWVSLFTTRLREEGGWDIWWDLRLLPGEQFDDAIESALDRARCVIVIWSQHSIGSRWVRSEAREGAQRGVLVPLRIGGVTPPLEFRSFETADMSKWHGDAADADFAEIVHVVRRAIHRTSTRTDPSPKDPSVKEDVAVPVDTRDTRRGTVGAGTALRSPNLQSRAIYLWGGGVAAAIVIVVGIGLATRGGAPINPPVASPSTTVATTSPSAPVATTAVPTATTAPTASTTVPASSTTASTASTKPPTPSTKMPAASTKVPAAQLDAIPRRLPELSYGTWTLHNAVDMQGNDWSNSTIKFSFQERTLDGLTLKGTMTWRVGEMLIGTEGFSGRYVDASRQIFLEGQSVSDRRLALGSYSAVLSADERSLLKGTWGSTAAPDQLAGVPGRWEASR